MPGDQVADLVSDLAAVNVSSSPALNAFPIQFGTFSPAQVDMENVLETQIRVNQQKNAEQYDQLQDSLAEQRQDSAAQQEVLDGLVVTVGQISDNIKLVMGAMPNLKTPGPQDAAGVAEALKDPASRLQALEQHGPDWLDSLLQPSGGNHAA